jgi:hypothetical protein
MDAEERIIAGNGMPSAYMPGARRSNSCRRQASLILCSPTAMSQTLSAIFVADPFMIRHNGLWYMFFEVYNEHRQRGDRGGSQRGRPFWQYRGRVLVEDFSVSYPHVFPWQGQIYMVPEMYSRNCVRLYRAESFPYDWRPVANLIEDGPVADPSRFVFENPGGCSPAPPA